MQRDQRPTESLDDLVPVARRDDLVIAAVEGDTLVYDRRRHRAHSLNSTAALVWRHCDGRRSVRELAALPVDAGAPLGVEAVELALQRLDQAALLEQRVTAAALPARYSRQAVLRKAGAGLVGGAVVLPVVTSVVAPSRAFAVSPFAQPAVKTVTSVRAPSSRLGTAPQLFATGSETAASTATTVTITSTAPSDSGTTTTSTASAAATSTSGVQTGSASGVRPVDAGAHQSAAQGAANGDGGTGATGGTPHQAASPVTKSDTTIPPLPVTNGQTTAASSKDATTIPPLLVTNPQTAPASDAPPPREAQNKSRAADH